MKRQQSFLVFLFFLFFSFPIQAQIDSLLLHQMVSIKMVGGVEYGGLLLQTNDSLTTLDTKNGKYILVTDNIKRVKTFSYTGKYLYANPYNTRYFVAPSAIPLQKGKVYYENYLLSSNGLNYGLTKNISISGAMEFLNLLSLGDLIWTLNTKAGFPINDNLHLAGGVSWTAVRISRRRESKTEPIAFIPYFVATLGNPESNISLGINYNFTRNSNYISNNDLILSLSGVHRLSNKLSLLIENNISIEYEQANYIGILGVNLHPKKNAFRMGLIYTSTYFLSDSPVFPYIGYSRKL